MKKIIVLSIVAGIVISTQAQPVFGIFAGPQSTTAKYTVRGSKQSATSKYGFHLGGVMKVPFDNNLYFAPTAFYSLKGYKVKLKDKAFPPDTTAVDNNTSIHTFELALLLQYDLSKHANHFFIKAGPSLDLQLSGKEKFNLKNGSSVDRQMKFSFGDYGHFGANMLLQFGYETKQGFSISAMYGHGIGSINNADYGPAIHHRVYSLTLGKYFVGKKLSIDTRNKE
ncbi:MAG: porin family protein [Chitinophagaceae bacterium]